MTTMTPELDKYYSDRFSMMSMDGWKELTIDIDNMIESLNNISVIPDEKTLMFKKGELSILTWLKTPPYLKSLYILRVKAVEALIK